MRLSIIIFLAIVCIFSLQAQKNGYRFDQTTYDFGDVQVWSNQPAQFSITNTGNKKILFLPTFPKDDIFVELPEGSILPGENAIISVYYFTNGLGEFKRKVPLYTNISNEEIELTVKGNILSLDPQAYIQCPGFAPKQEFDKTFQQEVLVLDGTTKKPVDEATVWLNTQGNQLKIFTKDNGIAKENILIGLYDIRGEKEGYISSGKTVYMNKQTGKIIIELEREIIPDLAIAQDEPEESEIKEREPTTEEYPEITFETYERTTYEDRIENVTLDDEYEEIDVTDDPDIRETAETKIPEENTEEIFEEEDNEPSDRFEEEPAIISNKADIIVNADLTPAIEEALPSSRYNANNIVFLIDVSSSMRKPEKLPLLKTSMKRLTEVLRKIDKVSVITYSSEANVVLSSTTANNKQEIITLIDSLKAEGWTHGVKGIETAYEMIETNFISGGNNQIILATDGVFNNPSYSERDLFSLVRDKSNEEIILSVIGFGDDSDAIRLMKRLANKGNGSFLQIENLPMANNLLIDEIKLHSMKNY